jgi:hypothetical protein
MTHPFDNFQKIDLKEFKLSEKLSKKATESRNRQQLENKDFLKDWVKNGLRKKS